MARRYPTSPEKQSGVALITALLVVAVATLIAADLVWERHLQTRRTAAMLANDQGRLYALGAESWAIDILLGDRDSPEEIDFLGEDWAQELPPIELPEGSLIGRLEDMQGRFNINNIYRNGQVDEIAMAQLRRLLRILELDEAPADAILDWIDSDQDICCAAGAEDDVYTNSSPAFWTANRYLTSTSELLAIEGIDSDFYNALAPYIAALPPEWCGNSDFTHINVNTAPAAVLLALDEQVSQTDVDRWLSERDEFSGYDDLGAFEGVVSDDMLAGNYLGLNTECFGAYATINIGSFRMSMYSLLDRQGTADSIVPRIRYFGVF